MQRSMLNIFPIAIIKSKDERKKERRMAHERKTPEPGLMRKK